LNTTLMPHSITHGDGCFAYFNKIRGILLFHERSRLLIEVARQTAARPLS